MWPRSISQALVLLALLHSLVFQFTKCQDAGIPEETRSLEIKDVLGSQPQEFQIIPGVTERLLIKLQRPSEEITLDFHPSATDSTMFEIQVLLNQKIDSTHYMSFKAPETLILRVDEMNGECMITGDQDFFMKVDIPKDNYKVQMFNERNINNINQPQGLNIKQDTNRRSHVLIGIGITIGAGGFMLLALRHFIVKRKNGGLFSTDKYTEHEGFQIMNSEQQNFTEVDLDKPEQVLKKETLENIDTDRTLYQNKESTIVHLSRAVIPSRIPFPKKIPSLQGEKKIGLKPKTELKKKKKTSIKAKTQQNLGAKPDLEPIKEFKLSLQVYLDEQEDNKKSLSYKQIKALVRKMEEEGTLAQYCDPSAESDNEEDQYEAPVLPNYFCCMVCLQGERSTIVNPCRHIFSCKDCVGGLLESYKICVLCSNEITSYEAL